VTKTDIRKAADIIDCACACQGGRKFFLRDANFVARWRWFSFLLPAEKYSNDRFPDNRANQCYACARWHEVHHQPYFSEIRNQ
ncbi:MAG: hypothetical protein U0Y68_19175, partial [Blastocatellia bacterium]